MIMTILSAVDPKLITINELPDPLGKYDLSLVHNLLRLERSVC